MFYKCFMNLRILTLYRIITRVNPIIILLNRVLYFNSSETNSYHYNYTGNIYVFVLRGSLSSMSFNLYNFPHFYKPYIITRYICWYFCTSGPMYICTLHMLYMSSCTATNCLERINYWIIKWYIMSLKTLSSNKGSKV